MVLGKEGTGMNRMMPFVDLAAQQRRIRKRIEAGIQAVLDHGQYIQGPEIWELETKLGEYAGMPHAISCSSGTDALFMALMAHGVGPGDAVFTTPFTFISTAEVISLLGATPVFVDIDPRTFNMDPDKLEKAVGALSDRDPTAYPLPLKANPQTLVPRGVIAVDMFGLPADYDRIQEIAEKRRLFLVEDAAQSFGAVCNGRKAASLAEVACTSFFPAKPLGCYGDGGMCFAGNDDLADIMRSIRIHGKGADKYNNIRVGLNGRMDTLQAAILLVKFEIFSDEIERRQVVARQYTELLAAHPFIRPPWIPHEMKSAWAQYSILLPENVDRAACREQLAASGVPTAVYYPKPLHRQQAFAFLGYEKGDFPNSEACADAVMSLPMHPYLSAEEQETIVGALVESVK
jgi:dTDP-4-amino-4,6-dideoxygalactose transaminase